MKPVIMTDCDENKSVEIHFDIFFQPLVDLQKKNNFAKFEVLTRFSTPQIENIAPDKIFSNSNNRQFFKQLDLNIFQETCKRINEIISKWEYGDNYQFSVNITEESIKEYDDFLEEIYDIAKKHKINNEKIVLEITERGIENLSNFVKKAQYLGFNISIDDIETKNFTISKLREEILPSIRRDKILEIKIDKSFVKGILDENNYEKLLDEAVISMILNLKKIYPNIKLVAEGVGDYETAKYLCSLGIDYGQGFFWQKPKKLDENLKQPNFFIK